MRRPIAICGALFAMLATAGGATAGSLPEVSSGERPGPPLLYAPPPTAPQLAVTAPFTAKPLLVSGTDALRGGEYLYQDYLFDDHGANTSPGLGSQPPGTDDFSPSAGDAEYPDDDRYANNAADIVEVRVKPTADEVVFRITLNTVKDDDATVVGIGIDTDRDGGSAEWPRGAGISSPGIDRFITAWGTGGQFTHNLASKEDKDTSPLAPGAVSMDTEKNQMTVRVPRSQLDPGTHTWGLVAGAGLFTGDTRATGDAWMDDPGVMNLAFRFDEPLGSSPADGYDTGPGYGNFYEAKQADALADGTTGDFRAEVDFGKLAAGADEDPHAPGEVQARIFASGLGLPEGVGTEFPQFGGALQPYILRVPDELDQSKPAGLTFSLHSLGGTYTQYANFSPNQLEQFGDQRGNLVATTLGRGPNGWYTDEAEADFFEVWRDIAQHFQLDPERVYPSGYSMGGYGTYRLGVLYPDLFARAFTTVGPPGNGIWPVVGPPTGGQVTLTTPLLENVRWLPYMNWVAAQDELVPYVGPVAQQQRFDELGLRSELWTFEGDHFTLAVLDRWEDARDFLGDARARRDPPRVNYAFFPESDKPALGLRHDHAYWVSGLRARVATGDPKASPARAEIDARSLASGEGDPTSEGFARSDDGPPAPAGVRGTRWTGTSAASAENALEVTLDNVSRAVLDGRRAELDGGRSLRVKVTSDGPGEMRLDLPFPAGVQARLAQAPDVSLRSSGASIRYSAGTRTYVIEPATAAQTFGRRAPATDTADPGKGSDEGADDPTGPVPSTGSSDSSLPFTGLAAVLLAACGLAMLAGGLLTRRHTRA